MTTLHRGGSLSGFRAVAYYATVGYQRPCLYAPGLLPLPPLSQVLAQFADQADRQKRQGVVRQQ